jgi:hypothetical protein
MKIRIELPNHLRNANFLRSNDAGDRRQSFIDDILMWGMETNMDIDFYGYHYPPEARNWRDPDKRVWAVFSIEADSAFMFMLKWSATYHKDQKEVM